MSYFLCIFVLATLPNAMAIRCYTCTPGSAGHECTSDLNVTDCDTIPEIMQGMKPDACVKASYEFSLGNQNLTSNAMMCGMKSMCDKVQEFVCNQTRSMPRMTVKKCEAGCCFEDKCNGLAEPTDAGSIRAASFIVTFLSVMIIFAGVFIH